MELILYIFYFLIIGYALVISLLILGFNKVKNYECDTKLPKTTFSIIVPFRDEEDNLPSLLASISKLNYPIELFEVILVDDESRFQFHVPSFKFPISILKNNRLSNSPKKDAIQTAIQSAKNNWIITTDADCEVPKNWLLTIDNYIQNHEVSMIAATVNYKFENSFLYHFQQLNLASLQGVTIGSFGINKGFMCNGANFAYTKNLFFQLDGFAGNNAIASGDDVFLLQKALAKFPEKVHYLKSENAIVTTKSLTSWNAVFQQQVRWASKTVSYSSLFAKALGILVFCINFCLVLSPILLFFDWIQYQNILIYFVLKCSLDYVLIEKTNRFFKTRNHYYLLSSVCYPFFSSAVVVYALFGKYQWKGRQF